MNESDIQKTLAFVEQTVTYPDIVKITGASTNPEIIIDGKKKLIFCSNNYLGIAADPKIKESMRNAVDIYGMGSGGSRLVSGNTDIQEQLEKNIASFKQLDDAITFSTGYMANTGIIPALMKPPITSKYGYLKNLTFFRERTAIISDELNHASIVDGIRLSKAEKFIYKHCDINDLERQLRKAKRYDHKMIVTDGVFSMDGDIAPLPEIMDVAKMYGATVMIDDAHATGVLGKNGRGTVEHFQLATDPDITMGTFTKVFGGVGGYVVGSSIITKYLRITARSYIFSAPIPPVIAAGLVTAIDIVKKRHDLRKKLWENISFARELLHKNEFNTLESQTQIIPIFIGDEEKAIIVSRKLLEHGFFIACVRWPAVKKGESRLRMTIMAHHNKKQIEEVIENLIQVRKNYPF